MLYYRPSSLYLSTCRSRCERTAGFLTFLWLLFAGLDRRRFLHFQALDQKLRGDPGTRENPFREAERLSVSRRNQKRNLRSFTQTTH